MLKLIPVQQQDPEPQQVTKAAMSSQTCSVGAFISTCLCSCSRSRSLFSHITLCGVYRKLEHIQWAGPYFCHGWEENGQIALSWEEYPINRGVQKSISKCTTYQTLMQMCCCSRRPHWRTLLSAKSRKLKLQFAQTHQKLCLVWWVLISVWAFRGQVQKLA